MTDSPEMRIAPVPFAEWDEETRTVLLAHLRRKELYLSGDPDAPPMPVIMELFANHVALSETFLTFMDLLASDHSTLDPRLRELVILRVAFRARSGYEWNQHDRMGRQEGLTEAQIQGVQEGPGAAVWDEGERAVVAAVDEMIDHFAVSEGTWQGLAAAFSPQQLVELLFVIGGYLCLATVLNSVGLGGELPGRPSER